MTLELRKCQVKTTMRYPTTHLSDWLQFKRLTLPPLPTKNKQNPKTKQQNREFPGSLVVRIWRFHHRGPDLISGLETKIPHQANAHSGQQSK